MPENHFKTGFKTGLGLSGAPQHETVRQVSPGRYARKMPNRVVKGMRTHYLSSLETTLMILSSVTDRYQTTIPKGVRDALGIRRGDTIAYELSGDQVVLRRGAKDDVDDPALLAFLDLLERDIAAHPTRLQPVPDALVSRARELVRDVEIDLDAAL